MAHIRWVKNLNIYLCIIIWRPFDIHKNSLQSICSGEGKDGIYIFTPYNLKLSVPQNATSNSSDHIQLKHNKYLIVGQDGGSSI